MTVEEIDRQCRRLRNDTSSIKNDTNCDGFGELLEKYAFRKKQISLLINIL